MLKRREVIIGAVVGLAVFSRAAHSAVYFSTDAVQKVLFPTADRFEEATVTLTPAQMRAIAERSKTRVRRDRVPVWRAMQGDQLLGHVVVDEVLGKHEFITYAIALAPDDSVAQIEIMEFHETYGDEVRNERWRAQFHGRRDGDSRLRVDHGIANISGATLSCVHITDGVRRILATFAVAVRGT